MKKILIICWLFILFFLVIKTSSAQDIPLSSCGNITNPGNYYLTTDVSSPGMCFNITSGDVFLDCKDKTIVYSNLVGDSGISAINSFLIRKNVTIKSCNLKKGSSTTKDYPAIILRTVINSEVSHNNINISWPVSSDSQFLIDLLFSKDTVLYNNTITINIPSLYGIAGGIRIRGGDNNSVLLNKIKNLNTTSTWSGPGIFLQQSSNNNKLLGNQISGNMGGITIGDTPNEYLLFENLISANNISGGSITLTNSRNSIISNNSISCSNKCIYFFSNNKNSTVTWNKLSSPRGYKIFFPDSGLDYLINNIENNTGNGKPIFYFKNLNNEVIDLSGDTLGGLIVVNLTNVTIRNANIINDSAQVFFINSSTLEKLFVKSSIWLDSFPIKILFSNNNHVKDNIVLTPQYPVLGAGIRLSYSNNNNLINNTISVLNIDGLLITGSQNNTIMMNNITTKYTQSYGIFLADGYITNTANITLNNVITLDSDSIGIIASRSTISRNNITTLGINSPGIYVGNSSIVYNNIIKTLHPTANSSYGIYWAGYFLPEAYVFNNLINTTNSLPVSAIGKSFWNTSQSLGDNIVGGPYIGGNFYARANGSGYSQLCNDFNLDGICDIALTHSPNNTDYLPLSKQPPSKGAVLLVHGIYSNESIWKELEEDLTKNDIRSFKFSLIPNNGDIWILKNQLKLMIDAVKIVTGVDKVDIIAHSMGGLVTRNYITSNLYQNDIKKLIMLGTPNEGAPIADSDLAFLIGIAQGGDPGDTARIQMIPGSDFLTVLNNNYNPKNVLHHAIAGAELPANKFKKFLVCLEEPTYCGKNRIVTDSIVPESSVNLIGTCNIAGVTHANVLGSTYYNNQTVINAIVSLLVSSSTNLTDCTIPSTVPQGNNIQVLSFNGFVQPNSEQIAFAQINPGTSFFSVLNWTLGNLYTNFITPSGQIINITTYQNYPNITYETGTFDGVRIEWFTFDDPEQGNWTIKVRGTGLPFGVPYTITLFMTKSVAILASTNKNIYEPNEPIIIAAQLSDGLSPALQSNVLASVRKPDTSIESISLFDDGLHQDSLPNDGIYGNMFNNTIFSGHYNIVVNATGIFNDEYFQLTDDINAFVTLNPDLTLSKEDIVFSNNKPKPDEAISIRANINNIGNGIANNATILLYDGDPAENGILIGQNATDIPAGESRDVYIEWLTTIGDHKIFVIPSPYNIFLDANYGNEKAFRKLLICQEETNTTILGSSYKGKDGCLPRI